MAYTMNQPVSNIHSKMSWKSVRWRITGIAGNIRVLFTAHDAYMRDFHLMIPADCIASKTVQENASALKHRKNVLKADIRPSAELDIRALKRKAE